MQLTRKVSLASNMFRQRDFAEVSDVLKSKAWSKEQALGLRRDMTTPFPAPQATLPIRIRPIRDTDIPQLLDVSDPALPIAERRERTNRLHLLSAGFKHVYVAVTEDDRPCYVQWLITPAENALLRSAFGGLFGQLADDEMLLEGAYTPEAFRGKRIMPAAMALIAEQAAALGAKGVITYVGNDNIASLKGCKRAGFFPYLSKDSCNRLGRRRVTFTRLPENTPYSFDIAQ